MKIYTKKHTSKIALEKHGEKIIKRGGMYQYSGYTISYAFPMDSELPDDTQELVDAGKVTYRGSNYGTLIKIRRKEYLVSDEKFKELGWIKKIKFDAPYRKHT